MMMHENLPERLAQRLAEPLPGPMTGSRYEPHPCPWRHYDVAPPEARMAAVLLLLYPYEGRWLMPLTLRPTHLESHAGQVSLPGGAVESGESTAQAALREFHEELGQDGAPLDLLGTLSPLYVQASNYLVVPWVAAAVSRPRFAPNSHEVAEVLEMPVDCLFDPACFSSHTRIYEGREYTVPHFLFESHQIWGATCMILGELATVLRGIYDL